MPLALQKLCVNVFNSSIQEIMLTKTGVGTTDVQAKENPTPFHYRTTSRYTAPEDFVVLNGLPAQLISFESAQMLSLPIEPRLLLAPSCATLQTLHNDCFCEQSLNLSNFCALHTVSLFSTDKQIRHLLPSSVRRLTTSMFSRNIFEASGVANVTHLRLHCMRDDVEEVNNRHPLLQHACDSAEFPATLMRQFPALRVVNLAVRHFPLAYCLPFLSQSLLDVIQSAFHPFNGRLASCVIVWPSFVRTTATASLSELDDGAEVPAWRMYFLCERCMWNSTFQCKMTFSSDFIGTECKSLLYLCKRCKEVVLCNTCVYCSQCADEERRLQISAITKAMSNEGEIVPPPPKRSHR
jgi:hypothetical protein